MTGTRRILSAVWDFVVGDDWITAVGVAAAIAATAAIESAGVAAWWLLPLAVVGLLAWSLARFGR